VPERGDPRDALVGSTLEGLPVGGRVATGSVRRRAQLAALRPDLTFAGLRGNIDTRLNKAAGFQGIVMAMAALHRLGYEDRATEALSPLLVLPQVGQGALAVECRDSDGDVAERLAVIDHKPSHLAIDAERAFLAELGSGCDLPVGAYYEGGTLTGIIATLDGRIVLRASVEGRDPAVLGRELADRLLVDAGGWALLEDLRGSVA
jgi:hydroxymethylbilane synthase